MLPSFSPFHPPPLRAPGAAYQLTQPDGLQEGSAGVGRLPGLPGLSDAERQ